MSLSGSSGGRLGQESGQAAVWIPCLPRVPV